MRRKDWLATFLAAEPINRPRALTDGVGVQLDPIRIMKGMFLFQNQEPDETPSPLADPPYDFEPYAYGPFTAAIYSDLEELETAGLVEQLPLPGRTYPRWRLMPAGGAHVRGLIARDEIPLQTLTRLRAAKHIVMSRNFAGLLRYVYSKYPEYARESVAKL